MFSKTKTNRIRLINGVYGGTTRRAEVLEMIEQMELALFQYHKALSELFSEREAYKIFQVRYDTINNYFQKLIEKGDIDTLEKQQRLSRIHLANSQELISNLKKLKTDFDSEKYLEPGASDDQLHELTGHVYRSAFDLAREAFTQKIKGLKAEKQSKDYIAILAKAVKNTNDVYSDPKNTSHVTALNNTAAEINNKVIFKKALILGALLIAYVGITWLIYGFGALFLIPLWAKLLSSAGSMAMAVTAGGLPLGIVMAAFGFNRAEDLKKQPYSWENPLRNKLNDLNNHVKSTTPSLWCRLWTKKSARVAVVEPVVTARGELGMTLS
jgi:transposase